MAPNRPFERGGRRRHQRSNLLHVCNTLGLTSVTTGSARPNSSSTDTSSSAVSTSAASTGTRSSSASQRRQSLVRARRIADDIKGRGKFFAEKARRNITIAKQKLSQQSRQWQSKLETYERRYQLSQSAVSGAFTSTFVNVLCGSLVLGATSLVVAGVSLAVAERMKRRRRTGRAAAAAPSSYLGPNGRSFLVDRSISGHQSVGTRVQKRQC